ncbi:MAG: hypothetical protein ACPL4H_01240, partial [Anaerolineales bacterium]
PHYFKVGHRIEWVEVESNLQNHYRIIQEKLFDEMNPTRHDSNRLAKFLMDILNNPEKWVIKDTSRL